MLIVVGALTSDVAWAEVGSTDVGSTKLDVDEDAEGVTASVLKPEGSVTLC